MKYIVVGAALLLPLFALADSNPDAKFFKMAAEGGMAEVEQGKLAQEKGASASVKDFGAMMVKDHSAANEKLKALAATKMVTLPSTSSIGQMATKGKLEVLSGNTFDQSYVKGMVADHKEDIALFQQEASSGQDPEVKAFAKATLPTLKMHLKKVQAIATQAGIAVD